MALEMLMERDFDDGYLEFFCNVGDRKISFHPVFDITEDGPYFTTIAISTRLLGLSKEDILLVQELFYKWEEIISAYYLIFVAIESGPVSKSVFDKTQNLPLNDIERNLLERKLKQFTYIYLIKDNKTGLIKIGKSRNPYERLKQLVRQDTLLPESNDFILLRAWASEEYQERALHRQFINQRIRGEWFNLSSDDIQNIERKFFDEVCLVSGKSDYQEYEQGYQQYLTEQEKHIN